jgi:predicted DNA-binding transcriptional regulator AlpA
MMKPLKHRRLEPRGLSREEAADYVGVSPSLFDEMVKDGRMPQPLRRTNSRRVWDKHQLDEAIDKLRRDEDINNPWDDAA